MSLAIILGVLVVILLVYIYFIQFHRITTRTQLFTDELIESGSLKTGDLIIFKAFNNFNSIFINSYFGHVGVVYVPPDSGVPMLFEANGIEKVPLRPHHSKKGVFMTPLAERIKKYKGRCFWKPLNKPLSDETIASFKTFTDHCLEHFEYDYAVIKGSINRRLGISKCGKGTDCGQIVFLSLIKLGLIPIEEYDVPRLHHLKFVCDIQDLCSDYKYLDLVEIVEHPFAF